MAEVHLGIDVDTTDVTQADASLDRFEAKLRGATGTFGAVAGASQRADRGVRGFADASRMAEQRAMQATAQVIQLERATAGINRGFGALRGGITNAAFQFGDLSTQIGMGTRASTAFALQMPQLLGGFGALGAVLGAVSAIVIPLYRDHFDALYTSTLALARQWSETSSVIAALGDAMSFLAGNLDHVAVAAASLAAFMAGKWVVGFVAAQAATMSLAGALTFLRGALIRTGIGVLIVGAGELVYQFVHLVRATGSWGEALRLLGEVAAGVWEGIKTSASAIPPALGVVWQTIRADFVGMLSDLAGAWGDFLHSMAGLAGGVPGLGALQAALIEMRDTADKFSTSMGEAWDSATAKADDLAATAQGNLQSGFEQAAAAVAILRDKVKETEGDLGGAVAAAGDLADGLGGRGGAAGAAKKAAVEAEKLSAELEYQKKAADALVMSLKGLAFGTLGSAEGIGGAIQALTDGAFGKSLDDAFKDAGKTLSDAFGKAMDGLGRTGLSDFATASIGTGIGIAAAGVLNGSAQQIGGGIGSAVGGAIGSSLTAGLGGIVGTLGGPLGMILGGVAGGFIADLLGGKSKWGDTRGTAFSGTTFAQDVSVRVKDREGADASARLAVEGTLELVRNFNAELVEYVEAAGGTMKRGTVKVRDEWKALEAITGVRSFYDAPGSGPEAEQMAQQISARVGEIMALAGTIAQQAGPALTQAQQLWRETQLKFSAENREILKTLGFSAREITAAQQGIRRDLAQGFEREMLDTIVDTGRATRAELDKWKAAEIIDLNERRAAALATAKEIGASQALVLSSFKAQRQDVIAEWRDMIDDLVEEVARVTRGERLGFRKSALDELVGGGDTARLREWLNVNKAVLADQRKAQVAEARRLGVDVTLINRLYGQRLLDLEKTFAEKRYQSVVDAATAAIDRLTTRLNGLESQRSDVLQELTRRAEEARRAEQALADARAGLAGGDLNPGGPMDRFRALQRQFSTAIGAAGRGDADAAGQAASLAQSLLQAGRGVYASGGGYADLFRQVNAQLAAAQRGFSGSAATIEKGLDASTFVKTTEQSTKALLTALGRLNSSIEDVGKRIEAQTRQQATAEQRQRVGVR